MSLSTKIISEEEACALIELRTRAKEFIGDHNSKDHFLLRFLKARELNVGNAAIMLQNYVDWRNTNPDLKIIKSPNWRAPDVIIDDVKHKMTGFDNSGRPVWWVPMGRWEMRQHIQNGLEKEVFQFFFQFLDEIVDLLEIQQSKTGASQVVVILDMQELWFRKIAHYPSIQSAIRLFKDFEAYYPEILHVVFVVNAHPIFTYVFGIVKHVLSARTISKIRIYSQDPKIWQPVLLANIPADAIPEEYGGKGAKVLG